MFRYLEKNLAVSGTSRSVPNYGRRQVEWPAGQCKEGNYTSHRLHNYIIKFKSPTGMQKIHVILHEFCPIILSQNRLKKIIFRGVKGMFNIFFFVQSRIFLLNSEHITLFFFYHIYFRKLSIGSRSHIND